MIKDRDEAGCASVEGWRLPQENLHLCPSMFTYHQRGESGNGMRTVVGRGARGSYMKNPNSRVLTPVLLPALAQTGSREWVEPHPTHPEDEQKVPVDPEEAVGEGFRAARETWGSGHEHHAVAGSWSTRAVSSPKRRLSFRGASCWVWAHPSCGKCQCRVTSLRTSFKTKSETSSPVSLSRGGAPSPFHI